MYFVWKLTHLLEITIFTNLLRTFVCMFRFHFQFFKRLFSHCELNEKKNEEKIKWTRSKIVIIGTIFLALDLCALRQMCTVEICYWEIINRKKTTHNYNCYANGNAVKRCVCSGQKSEIYLTWFVYTNDTRCRYNFGFIFSFKHFILVLFFFSSSFLFSNDLQHLSIEWVRILLSSMCICEQHSKQTKC